MGKNKINRTPQQNPPLSQPGTLSQHTLARGWRAARGSARPCAALQPLLKMAPAPLQRGGHAKTALGSLPPGSGSTCWRAELH